MGLELKELPELKNLYSTNYWIWNPAPPIQFETDQALIILEIIHETFWKISQKADYEYFGNVGRCHLLTLFGSEV